MHYAEFAEDEVGLQCLFTNLPYTFLLPYPNHLFFFAEAFLHIQDSRARLILLSSVRE